MRINSSRINHALIATWAGGIAAAAAFALTGLTAAGVIHGPERPASAVSVSLTAAESISAGTHSPHASGHGDGRTLPAWVKVWHTRYRSGPHGAPCVKIGTAGRPRIGAVCANGRAFVLPLGSPHGRPYSHRDLPRYVKFWTTDSAGVIVIGGGSADTTLQACRTCVPNLQVS